MILIVWQLDLQIPVQSVLIPLTLWVRIQLRWGVLHTTLYDKACQWLVICRRFSPGTPVSSTNKTDRHDIAEMLLQVALNSILLLLLLSNLLGWTLIIKLTVYLQSSNFILLWTINAIIVWNIKSIFDNHFFLLIGIMACMYYCLDISWKKLKIF